jgi:hypothetical protein
VGLDGRVVRPGGVCLLESGDAGGAGEEVARS